ncbi:MAG: PQQ-binding-like beta-propeller repeat protein [Planctomycetes bacterium]|nr:PQQ-binding-like beta-propeller repeat protein [Planctomycetota bacterium]
MIKQSITFIIMVFSLGINSRAAGDWAGFRGPGARGSSPETGLATTWSETENLQWKTPLPGPGSSSPIVSGDKVFVTCHSGYGMGRNNLGDPSHLKRHLVCINTVDGKVYWDKTIPAVFPEIPYSGRMHEHGYASHTPATDGKRVYVFFGKSGVLAFDLRGNLLWQYSVGTGSDKLKWGSASSPTLYNDLVFVNAWDESKTLYALNKYNGKQVWKQDLSGTGLTFTTPVLAELTQGSRELIVVLPNYVWGLNPDTGEKLWWIRTTMKGIIIGTPVIVGDRAYVHGGGPNGLSSLSVRLGGRGDVTDTHVLWSGREAASVPSPTYWNGLLYWVSNDGKACCQDPQNGELKYSHDLPVAGRFAVYASMVSASNRLYAVTRKGGTFVLAAGPEFDIIAHNKFESDDSDFNGSPAISKGRLFLRSNRFLYCVGF